jgi:hypothetical protein
MDLAVTVLGMTAGFLIVAAVFKRFGYELIGNPTLWGIGAVIGVLATAVVRGFVQGAPSVKKDGT